MLRYKSVCAVLLALSFLFNGAQGVSWNVFSWNVFWQNEQVIGYATVSEEQAHLIINAKNKLYKDDKLFVEEPQYAPQTGSGFYILNEPGNWPRSFEGEEERWYCAIKAEKTKMKEIGKINIPITLFSSDEDTIVNHIKSTKLVSDPKKALRFSWVKGFRTWQVQMLIPTDVITNDDLELRAHCFASEQELMNYSSGILDWKAWKIKSYLGRPGPYSLDGRYYGYA